MSGKVMGMIMDRYPAQHGEFKLALALGNFASEDGCNIYPSVETMAAKSRQDVRSVQRHLKHMLEIRWLLLVRAGGGRGRPTMYRINPHWMAGEELPLMAAKKGDTVPGFSHDKTVTPVSGKGDTGDAPYRNHKEPISPQPPTGGDGFDGLCRAYPRHRVNYSAALKRWQELAPDAALQAILIHEAGVQSRKAEWQDRNGQAVPKLSGWLLNRGWLWTYDPPEAPSAQTGASRKEVEPADERTPEQRKEAKRRADQARADARRIVEESKRGNLATA